MRSRWILALAVMPACAALLPAHAASLANGPWTTWHPAPVALPSPNAYDLYLKAFAPLQKIDLEQGLASDKPLNAKQLRSPQPHLRPNATDEWRGMGPADKSLAQRVALYSGVLDLARQALREQCRVPPPQTLEGYITPVFGRFRELARLYGMEAEARRDAGHFAASADSALDCMAMGRQIATGRTINAYLTGEVCAAIGAEALDKAAPHLTAPELHHVLTRLAAINDRRIPLKDLLAGEERFDLIAYKETGADPRGLLSPNQPGSRASGRYYITARDAAKAFASLAAAWRQTIAYYDQLRRSILLPYRLRKPVPLPTNDLARMEADVYPLFELRYAQKTTRDDLLLASLAARCYLLEHGKLPHSLQDLDPAYLRPIPLDAFSGGYLRSKLAGGALVIYSVGPDGKDDGGRPIKGRIGIKSTGDMVVTVRPASH